MAKRKTKAPVLSDRAILLRGIAANPDDQVRKLAFADWLDEHGEPARAAFIRASTLINRMGTTATESDDFPGWQDIVMRAARTDPTPERRTAVGWRWLNDWPAGVTCRDGFVVGLNVALANWVKIGPEVVVEHTVKHLVFSDSVHPLRSTRISPSGRRHVYWQWLANNWTVASVAKNPAYRWLAEGVIPDFIGRHLPEEPHHGTEYSSDFLAITAVGVAGLNWARDRAGLEPYLADWGERYT